MRPILALTTTFLVASTTLLVACAPGDPAARSWEQAAQGLYTGEFSSDGNYSVVGSLNHGGSLWRTTDAERLFNWNHKQGEYSELVAAAFSPDGQRVVTTDPRTLVLWDATTGEALSFWTTPASALDLAIGPDGRSVLIGQTDHSAVLFDAVTGDHLKTYLHEGRVVSVGMSHDGQRALTGSEDNTAKLWDVDTGELLHTLTHDNPVRVAVLSPSGGQAFTAAQGRRVCVWDAQSGERTMTLFERNPGVTSAAFSADGRYLLVGYLNRVIELWDTSSGSLHAKWHSDTRDPWRRVGSAVLAVGFASQPGVYLAIAGDGMVSELR